MSTDDRYIVDVNGHAVEPGCWVDGHWGQYGPDRLAEIADGLGWLPQSLEDDPRGLRVIADALSDAGYDHNYWERHIEAADGIETWLNDHTATDGYSWGWYDGEFYLWPNDEWEQLP
jgi:hypothetical protein